MTIDDLIQAGMTAARKGDLEQAAKLFARAVKSDPNSEQGWLWLGKCIPDPNQREYCIKHVLALNPNNLEALQNLKDTIWLDANASQGSVPLTDEPAVSSPTPISEPSFAVQAKQVISPFVIDNEELSKSLVEELPPLPQPPVSTGWQYEQAGAIPQEEKPTPPPKKKVNPVLVGFLWSILVSLGCLVVILYLVISGTWMKYIPTNLLPLSIPNPTIGIVPLPPMVTQTTSQLPTITSTASEPTYPPTVVPTVAYTPTFKSERCTFVPPTGITVSCGYLTVPEDRTDPDSPNIQIAVAVFHSTSTNPAPDPVIFLQGGPGGEAIMTSVTDYTILVSPFLYKRDYIAFDQRGTGLSKPAINCQELETVYKQDMFGQIPSSSRNMIYTNAFRSCHGMMTVSGMDLNAFNTLANADDLKDLVTTLGYSQVNLYGASYGTRLALVTMRNHPEILKSVVLDSVVPVEARLLYEDPSRINSSLQALFDGCAVDPKCAATYPDLKTDFWNMVAQLDAHPVSVTAPLLTGGKITETVTGSDLLGVTTYGLLKWAWMIPTAPMSLDELKAGDYSTFVAMQSSLPDEFKGINIGVYISVMCHEHILSGTSEELRAIMDVNHDIGKYMRLPFFGDAKDMFNTCKVWGSIPPVAGEKDPVVSDIPTLIIEGTYDPSTPPMYGKQVAKNLSHSFYVEFSNQGHVPLFGDTTGCASGMILAFFDNPVSEPDHACLANLPPIKFITPYTGNPPIQLAVEEGYGLTAKMPIEWNKFSDGFYRRDNSPLDITQLVVARAYFFDSSALLDSLSSKLYGYQGFDAAPILVGNRNANGLDWSLYETTSYGRPVELAMADSAQGDALIVLLFCHKDELDALYQTLYLPIIDSVVTSR